MSIDGLLTPHASTQLPRRHPRQHPWVGGANPVDDAGL